MNLVQDSLKKIYPKFLFSALGSAIISSIYSLVDTVMIGQYEGPAGSAALAVMMPMYTIIFSLGLLFGVGGAVLMSVERGRGDVREGNRYFTLSICICGIVIAVVWAMLALFDDPLLRLFGGSGETFALAKRYFFFIKLGLPLFTFGQCLSCFVRNDGNPVLATVSVLSGGIFNIVGDYLLIFPCDLGMEGAAIATISGQALSVIILLAHFFTKRRRLALVRPTGFFRGSAKILYSGLGAFVIDLSFGILCILYNNRVMFYLGEDALAVYGVAINVFILVQSLAYGVGQAAQPILSENYGAGRYSRVKTTVLLSVGVSVVLSAIGLAVAEGFPVPLVKLFMDSTPQVEAIAPRIIRIYCLAYLFMPFNVFALYFFQSVMRSSCAWIIAIVRGVLLSGTFVFLLPVFFGGEAIWWAMPLTELMVFGVNLALVSYYLHTSGGMKAEP